MGWKENVESLRNDITKDLEERGVNAAKWWESAEEKNLLQKCLNCYAKHYGRGKFDEHLHKCGIRLRMNSYCEWLLQEYPELKTQDVVCDTK